MSKPHMIIGDHEEEEHHFFKESATGDLICPEAATFSHKVYGHNEWRLRSVLCEN